MSVEYVPAGFGSHHRPAVELDWSPPAEVQAASATAVLRAREGLELVVAPLPDADGRPLPLLRPDL